MLNIIIASQLCVRKGPVEMPSSTPLLLCYEGFYPRVQRKILVFCNPLCWWLICAVSCTTCNHDLTPSGRQDFCQRLGCSDGVCPAAGTALEDAAVSVSTDEPRWRSWLHVMFLWFENGSTYKRGKEENTSLQFLEEQLLVQIAAQDSGLAHQVDIYIWTSCWASFYSHWRKMSTARVRIIIPC